MTLGATNKRKLREFAKQEGFTSIKAAMRELETASIDDAYLMLQGIYNAKVNQINNEIKAQNKERQQLLKQTGLSRLSQLTTEPTQRTREDRLRTRFEKNQQ